MTLFYYAKIILIMEINNNDKRFMALAISEAEKAKERGDWPFGALVVQNGKVVGRGHTKDKTGGDVTEHAEIVALREACKLLQTNDLSNCTIYCSNEPCLMCATAIFQAYIPKVFIGASRDDLKNLLRPRKLRIEDLVEDTGHKVTIIRGVLKDKVLGLFKDIKK